MINNYNILQQIGKGGCSTVYLSEKNNIKFVCKKYNKINNSVYNEIDVLKKLNSEYVDNYVFEKTMYLIMVYHPEYIPLNKIEDKITDYSILSFILKQLCDGIKNIHDNGIIHLDIKPGNLLINSNNEIKYIDFSTSLKKENFKPNESDNIGTINYMDPFPDNSTWELFLKSDLYSIGCVMCFIAIEKTPFEIFMRRLKNYISDTKLVNELNNSKDKGRYWPMFKVYKSYCKYENFAESINLNMLLDNDPKKRDYPLL